MWVQLCTFDIPDIAFMTLLTIISMVIDSPGLTPVPGPGSTAAPAFQELSPQCTENHPAADTGENMNIIVLLHVIKDV